MAGASCSWQMLMSGHLTPRTGPEYVSRLEGKQQGASGLLQQRALGAWQSSAPGTGCGDPPPPVT